MSLRDLEIKEQYRSDKDNLLVDFYLPCLEISDSYHRAVGFFTSSGLAHAAKGLIGLISRGGKMKLVASPRFTADDIASIQAGYALRDVINKATVRELEKLEQEEIIAKISNLAWLVSHHLLEIKVAVTSDPTHPGIFHEKVGIFHSGDEIVAFSGSPNETEGGLVSNFECIDVYTSWNDPKRVELKVQGFDDLWLDNTQNLHVLKFPEAAKRKLLSYAPKVKPVRELGVTRVLSSWYSPSGMEPYDFQRNAIQRWQMASCRGILEMATGTGKTFIALSAIAPLIDEGYSFMVIVPRKLLAQQWDRQIKKHYPRSLTLICTGEHEWKADLQHYLDLSLARVSKPLSSRPIFYIVTFQTAYTEGFLSQLLPFTREAKFGIVVDEVHWAGASVFSRIFEFDVPIRMGLSATPKRHFDPEGTELILEYFGGSPVFTFDIREAIESGMLTEYEYHVKEVTLESNEYHKYQKLTQKIAREISKSRFEQDEPTKRLIALLAERANIVKSAVAKYGFLEWVHQQYRPHRCLVYCSTLDHLRTVAATLTGLGALTGQYHSKMDDEARRVVLGVFEAGNLDYLVAIKCLDEGVDIPECSNAVVLSSSTNTREFIQRRGRVLRRAKGKRRAHVFDPVVVPSSMVSGGPAFDSTAKKILGSELKRVEEFGRNAVNSDQVLRFVKLLKARYGIL